VTCGDKLVSDIVEMVEVSRTERVGRFACLTLLVGSTPPG
jgi:hypothetical protein